jgi:hypothetical protein
LREQPTFKVSGPNKYKMPDSGYTLRSFEIHIQLVAIAYCGDYKPVRRQKSMQRTLYKQKVTSYRMFIVPGALLAGLDSLDNHWHEIFALAASHPASRTPGKQIFIRF